MIKFKILKLILLLIYITNVNGGIFSSNEENAFKLTQNKEYKKALEIINNDDDFNPNKYPIIYYANDLNIVKILIKKGSTLNKRVKRDERIIKILRLKGEEQYFDNTPLFKTRDAKVLQLLIKNGAKVNARGQYNETPLMSVKSFDAIKVFLQNGAMINLQTNYRDTALMKIIDDDWKDKKKHLEILKMVYVLLKLKADPNIQNNGGRISLHKIRWGHTDIAKLLVASGAKIDTKSTEGNSALCYAIADDKMELIKFYFRFGANFSWTCEKNMSLIEYSIKRNYKNSSTTKFLIELEKTMRKNTKRHNK